MSIKYFKLKLKIYIYLKLKVKIERETDKDRERERGSKRQKDVINLFTNQFNKVFQEEHIFFK